MATPTTEQVLDYLAEELPTWMTDKNFLKMVYLKKLVIQGPDANGRMPEWRGMADIRGEIYLSTSTWRNRRATTPYSSLRGKADTSPLGVFCHEVGHLVHWALPTMMQLEWYSLCAKDKRGGITSYARSCIDEDFAETFRLWSLNRGLLKSLSPKREAFMTAVCLKLSKTRRLKVRTPEYTAKHVKRARATLQSLLVR